MSPVKPIAALSPNAQIVYGVLDREKPQPAEKIAERVADRMGPAESWAAIEELRDASHAVLVMGGWTILG